MGMELFVSIDSGNHTNAAVMGLGELAAFLRFFAKRRATYPSPNSQPCYGLGGPCDILICIMLKPKFRVLNFPSTQSIRHL